MDKYLRRWRQEALNKGQHDAAIYVGDKVLALTSMLSGPEVENSLFRN
jgi:anaphase-promoting complex subunit 6